MMRTERARRGLYNGWQHWRSVPLRTWSVSEQARRRKRGGVSERRRSTERVDCRFRRLRRESSSRRCSCTDSPLSLLVTVLCHCRTLLWSHWSGADISPSGRCYGHSAITLQRNHHILWVVGVLFFIRFHLFVNFHPFDTFSSIMNP
jgi:hypothetical protein